MTRFQVQAIRFVAAHRTGFATPQRDGSVFIYSPASQRVDDAGNPCRDGRHVRACVVRDRARNAAEVRAILGY